MQRYAAAERESITARGTAAPLQVLAERLRGGPRSATVWHFLARADAIGDPPPPQLTAVPKAGITVTADSAETAAENGSAANAIDDNPYAIWHTYTGGIAPLPHEITPLQAAVTRRQLERRSVT